MQLFKDEQQIFCPGVPLLIVADVVHASFNISEMDETRRAILGPCAGGHASRIAQLGATASDEQSVLDGRKAIDRR